MNGSAYVDVLVVNGSPYCYQVSATNGSGEGPRTSPVCATPTHPAPPKVTPPHLTSVQIAHALRAARSGPGLIARGSAGVAVTYRLSKAATVTFRVERQQTIHGRTRWTMLKGTLSWTSPAGNVRLRFTGRLAGKRLLPGRYRLVLTARDRTGHTSQTIRSSTFTIKH